MSLSEEAFERINCYGIGVWLEGALHRLGQSPPESLKIGSFHSTQRASGLVLTLSRAPATMPDRQDELVLACLEGDLNAPMPFGLDPATETITSAASKLSTSVSGGASDDAEEKNDRRVSFFMDKGRVVELRFKSRSAGFDRFLLARLGQPFDWRDGEEN